MPAALLAALLAASPAVTTLPASSRARCTRPGAERVETRQPARVRKLGDMPPARQLLGVYREMDGCPAPAVVRAEVGQPRR